MKYDRNIVADNIDILMKDNNITQAYLAIIAGTHQSRISECLNRNKDFTLPQLVSIADYFNLSVDSLLNSPSINNTTNITINSLADVCNILFALSDNTEIKLSHEYVDEYDAFKGDVLTFDNPNLDPEEIENPQELIHFPASKGSLCLSFTNYSILVFLNEWSRALGVKNLSGGDILYDTWKQGIISKYQQHLKDYEYMSKIDYQYKLAQMKWDYCGLPNNEIEDELYHKLSQTFSEKLKPLNRDLLNELESQIGDLRKFPFLPDGGSPKKQLL